MHLLSILAFSLFLNNSYGNFEPHELQVHPQKVIIDQDGAIDDFLALTLLLCNPQFEVKAVTLSPADSFRDSAFSATKKVVDLLGARAVSLSASHFEGTHPFPNLWRADSDFINKLEILNRTKKPNLSNLVLDLDPAQHLVNLLSTGEKYTVLETGPLSNIANALKLDPSIKNSINRIFIMGGAVRVPGNVDDKNHDGSAEWNFYNDPEAAKLVVESGIPITLVALDATNSVPVHVDFLSRLKKIHTVPAQFSRAAYQGTYDLIQQLDYHFWDTLTALALMDSKIVETQKIKIRIRTAASGFPQSEGRSEETPDGVEVDVAVKANMAQVENTILDTLASCQK